MGILGLLGLIGSFIAKMLEGMMLLIVLVAVRLDITISTDFIRNTTIIAFLLNEILSLTENAGLMGIPTPTVTSNAIEILRTKSEREGHKNK